MTPDLLEYALRATTIWALLLAYYFLWGRRTSFRFQRILLLGGWVFGLAVPLLPALETARALPITNLPGISLTKTVPAVATEATVAAASWQWTDALPWVYLLGVLVFGARALVQSWRIRQCLADGERSSYAGYPVITSSRIKSPFAARGYVFMPEGLDPALTHTALLHETAHLRARHHYDKNLLTLGSILLWFHPLVWAYRRLLATIHEYEADAVVVQTVPVRTYGLQLLHCSLGPTGSLGLFSSPLKQRINMITANTKRKTQRLFPTLTLLFLLTVLTFACSDLGQSSALPVEEVLTETVEGPEMPTAIPNREGGFYGETNDLQTSMDAYFKDIYQEVRYPAEARASGTTGKFRAFLRLGRDGKIERLDISKFTDEHVGGPPASPEVVVTGYKPEKISEANAPELLVAEIDRVLTKLSTFQPLLTDGKPVRQTLNIDFNFKLE